VFFFRIYFDAAQDWTHIGIVTRVDSNGTVWMIDAPGAPAVRDPPDALFGRVREEPIAGSWLQHRPTDARLPELVLDSSVDPPAYRNRWHPSVSHKPTRYRSPHFSRQSENLFRCRSA